MHRDLDGCEPEIVGRHEKAQNKFYVCFKTKRVVHRCPPFLEDLNSENLFQDVCFSGLE